MEPFPGVEPGGHSIPGNGGRRSEGHELAGLESNQRRRVVQSHGAPADRATGQWSPRQDSNLRPLAYKATALASLSYRGIVRSTGFEPAQPLRTTGTSGQRVYRSATNAWSRHPVSNRASRLTGAGPQAVRGGEATGAGIEPAWPRFRALMGCQQPTRYHVGETGVEPACR
jgi:hypothetical protein